MIHHCLPWVGIPPNFSVKHTFPRPCSVISWQRNLRCPFRISVCNCLSTPVLSQTRLVVCKVRKTYTVPQILNKMTSSVQCSSKHTKGRTEKHSFSCQIQTMSCVLPRWCPLLVHCDAHAPVCLVLIRGTLCKNISANVNWMCSGFKVFRHKSKIRLFTKSKKTTLGVSEYGTRWFAFVQLWCVTVSFHYYPTSTRMCMRCIAPCSYKRTNAISRKCSATYATKSMWFLNWYTSSVTIMWSASWTVRVIVQTNSLCRLTCTTLSTHLLLTDYDQQCHFQYYTHRLLV